VNLCLGVNLAGASQSSQESRIFGNVVRCDAHKHANLSKNFTRGFVDDDCTASGDTGVTS
jgi:hypothetical protein